jgi:hypothetical protein
VADILHDQPLGCQRDLPDSVDKVIG